MPVASIASVLRTLILTLAALALAIGSVGLAGWALGAPRLLRLHPALPPIAFNTALWMTCIALGSAMLRPHPWIGKTLGLVVLAMASATIVEYRLDMLVNLVGNRSGRYDLVLMDVQMPNVDGHTATRQIRTWEREQGLPRTPIIALSAHALQEEAQQSLDAGCDAHLTKPIRKQALLEAIDRYARATF